MKNRILNLIVLGIMTITLISMPLTALAEDNITVMLDDNLVTFDVPPQMINDRTMVPMRAIFEELGYNVYWDEYTQKITAENNNESIVMLVGQNTFYRNESEHVTDVPPTIVDGRTLIPLRALGESLDYDVYWDQYHSKVWLYPMANITMEQAIDIAKTYRSRDDDCIWYIDGSDGESYFVTFAAPPEYMPEYGGGGVSINKNTGIVEYYLNDSFIVAYDVQQINQREIEKDRICERGI